MNSMNKYQKRKDGHFTFYEYCFMENGTIIDPDGNNVHVSVSKRNVPMISITFTENGIIRRKKVNPSRIMFEMYSGKHLPKMTSIVFLDGNPANIAFKNLRTKERNVVSWGERRFTYEEAENIRKDYFSRPLRKNQFDSNSGEYLSQRDLAEKYGCSVSTIEKVINGTYYKEKRCRTG